MQFHYVVFYDSETMKWNVEYDTEAYFSDGHVWDEEQYRKEFWGWTVPEYDTAAAVLDQELLNTLYSIVDIIPIPKEHEHAG